MRAPSAPVPSAVRLPSELDAPPSAAENMARDAALIAAVGAEDGPERLGRLFAWRQPALSLGRSNPDGGIDRSILAAAGIELVRRPTGGGALLHGTDLSCSVAVRRPRGGGPDLIEAGRALAEPVRDALRMVGVAAEFRDCADCPPAATAAPSALPLCFLQRTPLDLVVAGRKLAAFALRRTGRALFLHGSVLLRRPADRVLAALIEANAGRAADWRQALLGLAWLEDLKPGASAGLRAALAPLPAPR